MNFINLTSNETWYRWSLGISGLEIAPSLAELRDACLSDIYPTGSRIICPNGDCQDWDVVGELPRCSVADLLEAGWTAGGSFEQDNLIDHHFVSLRKGKLNFIGCFNVEFLCKFLRATQIAAKLALTSKSDRIALFRGILYDEPAIPSTVKKG